MNEEAKIELRSEEFQEVLGTVPPWILRWGILILAVFTVILLIGSAIFKYPDVISAQITLTGTQPPATIVARSSGKLKELFVADNQEVKTGEYLAVIDNPARTEDVLELKEYLDCFITAFFAMTSGESTSLRGGTEPALSVAEGKQSRNFFNTKISSVLAGLSITAKYSPVFTS